MAHGSDSDHADSVFWWDDVEGERHEGIWAPEQYEEVERVIIQLPDELITDPSDPGFREFSGIFFTEEYDFDDFYDEVIKEYE